MALAPGTRLGPYEVIAPIGAGGMGEVYRALDAKLGREVAIKVLPAELSGDPVALARFQREARAVAALSHPHILIIHDFGASEGVTYAVTELLTGETLRQRLDRGGLSNKRALEIAGRIALGLAAAHENDIVHRDLKPENLFLTKDGGVKILDFGLAKQLRAKDAPGAETLTGQSEAGTRLGTAGYMSPEQVRGDRIDHRSDIFSFGCVLYEMLTGRRAFEADTSVETMHAILKSDPPSLASLDPSISPILGRIVGHCLEKSPGDRFQSARDLSFALGALSTHEAETADAKGHLWRRAALLGGVVALAAAAFLLRPHPRSVPSRSLHATLAPPPGARIASARFPSLAISPDGRTVVFSAIKEGDYQLFQRALGNASPRVIPGTADGYAPFFSPDGQWIGFFAGGELKKMPLAGGQPVLVTHVPPVNFGATWGSDGRIVYTRAPNGELWWVSESGGDPRRLTRIDSERGEQAHLFPQFIGGSRALLFTVREGRDFQEVNKSSIAVLETATGKQRILLEGARFARFGGGRLVFLRGDAIFSVAFDATRLETIGPVTALGETVATNPVEGFANIDISPEGTLVYLDGPPDSLTLTKVLRLDRTGNERTLELPPAQYYTPRLSPDGRRLALVQHVVGRTEIVVYDRDRDLLSTVTPEAGRFFTPVWSPDGSRLGFSRFHRGNPALCLKRSDGGGDLQALTGPSDDAHFGNSWSPDGTTLAYTTLHLTISERDPARAAFSTDIYLVGTDGRRASRPWFESPFSESAAVFSPDGKSIAYVSDESGTNQVFARAYPDGQNKIQISTGSGMEPVWTRGGGELIYRTGTNNERFMAVSIRSSPGLSTSSPRLLFESDALAGVSPDGYREYDVSEDGNEFFTVRAVNAPDPERRLVVITDWAATQPH